MNPLLFERLFDDAAIFPPGNAAMPAAVRAHLAALGSDAAPYIGAFVCSGARLGELQDALGDALIDVSLTTDAENYPAAVHAVQSDPRMTLRSVEITTPDVLVPVAEMPDDAMVYLELPWGAQPDLPPGTGLKLRTGGATSDAFPTEERLAHALDNCLGQGREFKLTAGLHNAVRHTDPATGFEHHGFLNVILAVRAALDAALPTEIAAVLAEREPNVVANHIAALSDSDVDRIRRHFHSFGTCDTHEPLDDLAELGLMEVLQ